MNFLKRGAFGCGVPSLALSDPNKCAPVAQKGIKSGIIIYIKLFNINK
jgi:hypothetical protein